MNITQAVILAAGLGTRLRPLTDTCPKPMLPICGTPLLEHTIRLLKDQGCREFILNVHYLPDVVMDHCGDGSQWGVSITYSDERGFLLDTGGAIKKVAHLLHDTFLFMYGDELHRFNFQPVATMHRDKKALATLVLKHFGNPQNGEIAELDSATQRVRGWHARPHTVTALDKHHFRNSGLYVLSRDVVNHIPADTAVHLDRHVLPRLVAAGAPIYGFPTTEDILDIGTPEKYAFAEKWFQKKNGGTLPPFAD